MSSALGPAGRVPPAQRWLLAALGLALFAAGLALRASDLNARLLLLAHASEPSAVSVFFWSCLTVAGLGWAAVILVLAADRGAGRLPALLLPTFIVGSLLTHVPKNLLASPRPAGTALLPQLHIIGDVFRGPVSMPSGHSVTAIATAVLLCLAVPRGRTLVLALPILVIGGLVAWSRVVVGAHWPSDVVAGAGLGLLAVAAALALAAGARTHRFFVGLADRIASRAGQRWLAALEIAAAVGLLAERTGYPAGRGMVWLLAAVAFASAIRRVLPRAPAAAEPLGDARAERP